MALQVGIASSIDAAIVHVLVVCVVAGYAVGFFQGVFSIAYGSDYIMDIIPCDVVAAVTIAAAAKAASAHNSPAAQEVPIYHACSGHCHPVLLGSVFDANARFWKPNPPPLVLPGTK
jgi:hypothetical protein